MMLPVQGLGLTLFAEVESNLLSPEISKEMSES